jgi:hypothetical protein
MEFQEALLKAWMIHVGMAMVECHLGLMQVTAVLDMGPRHPQLTFMAAAVANNQFNDLVVMRR